MKNQKISNNVIRRLPRYIRYLDTLAASGVSRVSSNELGDMMGLTASQIRQDFNCFGGFGQQGYGYNIPALRDKLASILGMDQQKNAIMIGIGNLGHAIIKNFKFHACGVTLKAAFDVKEKIAQSGGDEFPLLDVETLSAYLAENPTDIAILTLPGNYANDICKQVIKAGVKGIWNFTNVELLNIPDDVIIENVHFSDSLLALNYYLSQSRQDA